MITKILLFILWLFIWLLLSWPPNLKQILIGAPVALFVTFMTIDTFVALAVKPEDKEKAAPVSLIKKILWFVCYIAVFLWESLKANIDVAWRVIYPTLPIRPGTIKVKTDLKSDIGLTFLANSITLTPGNTTIDVDKENGYIYIHVLSLKEDYSAPEIRLAVVTKYERILKRIFE